MSEQNGNNKVISDIGSLDLNQQISKKFSTWESRIYVHTDMHTYKFYCKVFQFYD